MHSEIISRDGRTGPEGLMHVAELKKKNKKCPRTILSYVSTICFLSTCGNPILIFFTNDYVHVVIVVTNDGEK
jgi:hypothetical protein